METVDSTRQFVITTLVSVKPSLDAASIHSGSSLTTDLGLDSLDLAELVTRIRDEQGPLDLTAWLADASRPGGDTVGSIVTFLHGAPSPAADREWL